ncbi:MAG: S41 family peptidase [Lentisphaeria bacterium]|jgi:carboxyl-terminal processing protease
MRLRNTLLAIAAAILALNLAGGYVVYSQEAKDSREEEAFQKVAVLMQVLNLIRQDYVDPAKVDYTELLYGAAQGMVATLDPYSEFLPPEGHQGMLEMTEGRFGGIGIEVTVRNGQLTVVAPIEDTPASRAGILAGDQVRKIDGIAIDSLASLREATKRLRGEPGTPVQLTIFRPATGRLFSLRLERAEIKVSPVRDVIVLDGAVGYLKLTEFTDQTAPAMAKALARLEAEKVKALVLDLRNNPGGTLVAAVQVCGMFLPAGKLVVATEGRRPSQKQEFHTGKGRKFPATTPVALLVNGGSASAAEILAGCLQDWGRAVLIGEKSFGKGSVQSLLPLADGSGLRLTTAHYYTPSRRIIHEHGIEPNIEVTLTEDDWLKLRQPDPEHPGRRVRPEVDRQLQRALEVLTTYTTLRQAQAAKFANPAPPPPDPAPADEPTAEPEAAEAEAEAPPEP